MEALQVFQVSGVSCTCLTTIEEAGENDRPVHLELRGLPDVVLVQDASFQTAKSLAGLADRALILSRLPSLLITLPRYLNRRPSSDGCHQLRWWVGGQLRQVLAETGPLSCRG